MTNEDVLSVISDAVSLGETILIVRNGDAIAEVMGRHHYSLLDGWITIGQEKGSHIHVKQADIAGLRFTSTHNEKPANCGLEILGSDDRVLLKISFRRTNPNGKDFDAEYARAVTERLG